MPDTPQAPSREAREAAAAISRPIMLNLGGEPHESFADRARKGLWDHHWLVQAFAAFERVILARPSAAGVAVPELREAIAQAISKADASFGYSFVLTRFVDGEETHTLTMPGFDTVEFDDRDGGYRLIAERRDKVRADAILALLAASPKAPPPPPSDDLRAENALLKERLADAYIGISGRKVHASDCATSNAPEQIPGQCDCYPRILFIDWPVNIAEEPVGWLGESPSTPEHFKCEFCGAEHLDCTLIPHEQGCPVLSARSALKGTPR